MTTYGTFENSKSVAIYTTITVNIEGDSCYLSFVYNGLNYNKLCIPTNLLFNACVRAVFPELPVDETNGFYRMDYWRNSWLTLSYVDSYDDFITERFGIDSSDDGVYILKYATEVLDETEYIDILSIDTEGASILLSLIAESRITEHDKT